MKINLKIASMGLIAASTALLLASCNAPRQPSGVQAEGIEDIGVTAFRDICLNSAPNFAAAPGYAKKYGINLSVDVGAEKMGMTADQTLGAQIQPGKECVVTTESRSGDAALIQFKAAIANATSGPAPAEFPFVGQVRGASFVFGNDRKGGETYVMLKKG